MHGAHCTLINPKIHHGVSYDAALPYIGKDIEFEYNPEDIFQSRVNFWLPIKCELGETIKKKCGIVEKPGYLGLHITLCNRKFNG